jgi:hypothetical protein
VCNGCGAAWSTLEVSFDALADELALIQQRINDHSSLMAAQIDRLQAHKYTLHKKD